MLGIINAALTSQGQYEVSENDGSNEWSVCARNWPSIVEAELEDGNYFYTRREETLTATVAGKFDFDYGYQVPSDVLHVRRVWQQISTDVRDEPDWTQDGSAVYVDTANGITIESIIVSEPDLWRPNFARGVQKKLEAVILRSLKEEFGEAREMEAEAETYFQRARTRSSQARAPRSAYRKGPIAEARFNRGAR